MIKVMVVIIIFFLQNNVNSKEIFNYNNADVLFTSS